MKLYNRIFHILMAVGLIFMAMLLLFLGEDGKMLIAMILGFSLLIYGIRCLVAYFIKFRYIVGGRMQLYIGIILIDLGLVLISSYNGSSILILIYLLGFRLVTGGIDVARAMEARNNGAPWKLKLTSGIISLVTVLLGIIYFTDPREVVELYCVSLIFSAVEHMIAAFRRNRIVTIA